MAAYEKHVRKILSRNGCTLIRHGKGDHEIWYSPISKWPITVDGEIKNTRRKLRGIRPPSGYRPFHTEGEGRKRLWRN